MKSIKITRRRTARREVDEQLCKSRVTRVTFDDDIHYRIVKNNTGETHGEVLIQWVSRYLKQRDSRGRQENKREETTTQTRRVHRLMLLRSCVRSIYEPISPLTGIPCAKRNFNNQSSHREDMTRYDARVKITKRRAGAKIMQIVRHCICGDAKSTLDTDGI